MNSSKIKNMIVLRNLPSNIIDEAFVFLKTNKKIEIAEKDISNSISTKKGSNDYIINEAEMLINDYLSKQEKDKYIKNANTRKLEQKCKKLKVIIGILVALLIVTFMI